MQFNRGNSELRPGSFEENRIVGRYLLDRITNLDETPLPFAFLDSRSYADKGSKSVQVKTSHSEWDRRQASLLLAVFGNGKARVGPVTESTIIATIHCPDVGYCLFRYPLVSISLTIYLPYCYSFLSGITFLISLISSLRSLVPNWDILHFLLCITGFVHQ